MGQITQTAPATISESPTKRIDSIRNQFWPPFCDDHPLLCHKEKAITLTLNDRRGGLVLSPTYDFTIFLGKISGKTADEVISTAEAEIHGLEFAFHESALPRSLTCEISGSLPATFMSHLAQKIVAAQYLSSSSGHFGI
jgi:hypothetical protein